jgi:hypothetical protein
VSALEKVAPPFLRLRAATRSELQTLETVRQFMDSCGQISIATEHVLHGGMYARTIRLKPQDYILGSLINLPTMLILNGCASVLAGNQVIDYEGYNVIPGSAGRQSLFIANSWVELTMIFPTSARTVDEAEEEVFAMCDLLTSRREDSEEWVTITGE